MKQLFVMYLLHLTLKIKVKHFSGAPKFLMFKFIYTIQINLFCQN